jgi:hypothetical protein
MILVVSANHGKYVLAEMKYWLAEVEYWLAEVLCLLLN